MATNHSANAADDASIESYIETINSWLNKYTNKITKRISTISECSPSLFIILYEAITHDHPLSNSGHYPKFHRERTLTLSQNEHNLSELLDHLKKRFKHSFILRNIDQEKLLRRNEYEITKFIDWFIQLENKRVVPYVPQLDDKPQVPPEMIQSDSSALRHRKKLLKVKEEKLRRDHEAFIKGCVARAKSKEEALMREYMTLSHQREKENLIVNVHRLKKKEMEMKCKLEDRKDSIKN